MSTTTTTSGLKIKGRKKIEKAQFNQIVTFVNQGDEFVCKVEGLRETETQYGVTDVLDGVDFQTGEVKSLFLPANLKAYPWSEMIGKYVAITYVKNEKNPETKRTYKVFDVEELEVE